MCNFIIRPIKSYATIDYYELRDGEKQKVVGSGDAVSVKYIVGNRVYCLPDQGDDDDDKLITIPMNVYTNIFSDKDPNKNTEKSK